MTDGHEQQLELCHAWEEQQAEGHEQHQSEEQQLESYPAWEELEWTEATIMADITSSQA